MTLLSKKYSFFNYLFITCKDKLGHQLPSSKKRNKGDFFAGLAEPEPEPVEEPTESGEEDVEEATDE